MKYNHTQIWYLPLLSILLLIVCFLGSYFYNWEYIILIILVSIVLFIVIFFICLNVSITNSKLKIKYWIGLFRKSFLLSEIQSVKKVKNKWYYWWWIRVWFWPKMWIYNISWFNTVEIIMYNGKIYRIWTDEVEKLEEEILKNIK